jgi:excisionase family DNA binding protein
MKDAASKQLLTVDEFAAAIATKPKTVRQRIWRGELEHIKIGRSVRLRAALVDELVERGLRPAIEAR